VEVDAVTTVLGASLCLLVGGPLALLVGALAPHAWSRFRDKKPEDPPIRVVLLLVLVELRSGSSVLAALIAASEALPGYSSLRTVARVGRVSGLVPALPYADDRLRPVVAQLARAQRSGASLSEAVRRLLDNELAADRTRRIARARTIPVRLMIPVTLLMLPGLVLLLYAPSLLGLFEDLTGVLG
jgi:hypothetical protein